MTFFIYGKGSKFMVSDVKENVVYTIKKKGLGSSKYSLVDNSGYELYQLKIDNSGKRPNFKIYLNDKMYLDVTCRAVLTEPRIEAKGYDGVYIISGGDRKNFKVEKEVTEIGSIKTSSIASGGRKYELTIEDKDFETFMPFFAVFLEMALYD